LTNNSSNWNTAYGWGDHSGLYLPLAGGTMQGSIDMNNQRLKNLASPSDLFDAIHQEFLQDYVADELENYLPINGKADDSEKLDNLDSTQFLRSDFADIKTVGDLTFNDNIAINFGTGLDIEMYFSGTAFYIDVNNGEDIFIRDGNSSNANRFKFDADNGYFSTTRIQHITDTDTYIHFTGSDAATFYAGGVEVGGFSSEGITPSSNTKHGGLKARLDGTTLYLRNDGSDA